jgi:hypothetical protein
VVMRSRSMLVLASALACGCAATAGDPQSEVVAFPLQSGPRNVGETGKALMAGNGDKTMIRLTITGAPSWVVRPVNLYTFVYAGSCARHDVTPAYALNEITQVGLFSSNSMSGPFTLEKTVPLPVNAIRASAYALVVRTSPADGNVDLYCGDMK